MQVAEQATGQLLPSGASLKDLVAAYERQLIERALEVTHGNQRRAAAVLGLLPTTLHEKMKRLGLLRRADIHEHGLDEESLARAS